MHSPLLDRIGTNGPIPFDVFMELCLYDADAGFFSAGAVRPGEANDFVTSPEISPLFGSLIGTWASRISTADVWSLVEIGAGSGTLLAPMAAIVPDAHDVWAVERSEASRNAIASLMQDVNVCGSVHEVNASNAVVVMNEVLDNVPAALVRREQVGWTEFVVERGTDGLVLLESNARPEVHEWAIKHLGGMPVGSVATVQLAAGDLIRDIFDSFDGVALCVVDYGGTTEDLSSRADADVVRTYRHQRTGFDFLEHPGEIDITVDVNTDAIATIGLACGAEVSVRTQREFLNECGAQSILDDLRDTEIASARDGEVMAQLKARSNAVGLRALVDPSGFGGFKVVTMIRQPTTEDDEGRGS